MEDIIIMSIIMGAGALISVTAIFTAHLRSKTKLHIQVLEKEVELERLRLETYTAETEKMRLELDHSKQQLLETRKQ